MNGEAQSILFFSEAPTRASAVTSYISNRSCYLVPAITFEKPHILTMLVFSVPPHSRKSIEPLSGDITAV
jgi:hypothetical protein